MPTQNRAEEAVADTKSFVDKVMASRLWRTNQRYGKAAGGLLAGGIAYSALFSIASALTIAWSVFMATLGKSADMREKVITGVNSALPGILKDGSGNGMIDPNALMLDSAITLPSVIAALVGLWTSVSIMSNIRQSVQSMFGIVAPPMNFFQQKGRDLLGFLAMAFGIILSSVLSSAAGGFGTQILTWIGLGNNPVSGFVVRVLGLLVGAAVAAATFAFLFRVTAAVRPLKRDLWLGSGIGGLVVQVILLLGTGAVSSVKDNPLLAASASLATLLLFVNLLARVLLYVAAFTANPPAPISPSDPREVHFEETPNFVTLSAPHTLKWEYQDVSGQVEPDPSLLPAHKRPDQGVQKRPDGKPIYGEDLGFWQRLLLKRRAHDHELKAVSLRARLGQRPMIHAAEREYWNDLARKARREQRSSARTWPVGATALDADRRDDDSATRERTTTAEDASPAQTASVDLEPGGRERV